MNVFTLVFLAALALSFGTRLWLARRHIRHVHAHREHVPEAFDIIEGLHRRPAREVFGYQPSWGLPPDEDRELIQSVMAEHRLAA